VLNVAAHVSPTWPGVAGIRTEKNSNQTQSTLSPRSRNYFP
jgi:hypothetical protein